MIALIDGDIEKEIKYIWLDVYGYPKFSIGKQNDYHVHRYVAEKVLGRKLKGRESIHHLNYNKQDCRRNNLIICPDDRYHHLLHARTDSINDGYNPDLYGYCTDCKAYHPKNEFPKSKNRWNGIHNICKSKQNARRTGNKSLLERRKELRRERRAEG